MKEMQSSPLGRFLFRTACLLATFAVIGIICTIREGLLDALSVGAVLLAAAALCWYIGFRHDYKKVMRGELYSERFPELFKGEKKTQDKKDS